MRHFDDNPGFMLFAVVCGVVALLLAFWGVGHDDVLAVMGAVFALGGGYELYRMARLDR